MDTEKTPDSVLESADDVMAHIQELQTKLQKIESDEAAKELPKEKYPLAEVIIKVDKGHTSVVQNCTPAKLAILVALHHKQAGGVPVHSLTLNSQLTARLEKKAEEQTDPVKRANIKAAAMSIVPTRETDPLTLRRELMLQFTPEKVKALYPGASPNFPKTFRAAVSMGMESSVEAEGLFTVGQQAK